MPTDSQIPDAGRSLSVATGSALLNVEVRHRSGAMLTGVITALCIRPYGVSIAVTWSDLTERWHSIEELTETKNPDRPISFLPNKADIPSGQK